MDIFEDLKQLTDSFDFGKKLESARITLVDKLPKPPPVLLIKDDKYEPVTVGTKGNISVIKGRAKSRKSFATAMLTAATVSDTPIYGKIFSTVTDKLVVYFDTEQSGFYVQEVFSRIFQMSTGPGFESRFYGYGLRRFSTQERLELIEWTMTNFKNIGFVVIDGIRDLVKDINSQEQATDIVTKLMKWSEDTGAHILTVLHENQENGKLRGHLGTELLNKAETVLRVEKLTADKAYSKIYCEDVRGLDFEPLFFTIDDFGVPYIDHEYSSKESRVASFLE